MSILFFTTNKNICFYIVVCLLSFFPFLSTIFAQEANQDNYFQLSDKLTRAKTYRDYIPESILVDTESLLNQLSNNSSVEDDPLLKIKINSRIELLDSYILNSEKKIELKNIENQIQKEDDAYRELEDINKKLRLEIENAG